jgi:tRNA(Ile)-lysidine synthase
LAVPELGGVLVMTPSSGAGLSLARLREHPVAIRTRGGGERLQPDRGRPRRTLKNLMQEARIPPWERERLPLVFCGSDLAWAATLGIDCAYQAAPGERSVSPSWRPAALLRNQARRQRAAASPVSTRRAREARAASGMKSLYFKALPWYPA